MNKCKEGRKMDRIYYVLNKVYNEVRCKGNTSDIKYRDQKVRS